MYVSDCSRNQWKWDYMGLQVPLEVIFFVCKTVSSRVCLFEKKKKGGETIYDSSPANPVKQKRQLEMQS